VVTRLDVAALLGLLALAALLLAALLVASWWHRRRVARRAHLRRAVQPMLAAAAAVQPDPGPSGPAWLDDLSNADARLALVACLEALPGLDSAAADRVRALLRRSRAARRERGRLEHRSAARRIEACRFSGRLGDTGAVPLLIRLLHDRDPAVRREAIRALGELRAVEAVPDIADAIEVAGEWDNLLLVMALIRMGPACAPAIGALLRAPAARSPATLKGLLQVTSRIGVAADHGVIRSLASHQDLEVRVEAVRVLGAIGPEARSGDVCLAAMDDGEWPVRAVAAASLGRLRDERALPRLAQAMGDPAYWVRHHVAEAMASLGEPGAVALRSALDHANPFVRDMAAQALFMRALADGEAA
jgi:HEAT repeat protein